MNIPQLSAKDLEMAIKYIWTQKITAEYCKHLVHIMPCRLQVVINNKSGQADIPNSLLDSYTKAG